MRFGTWRGVAPVVAFTLAAVIATGVVATGTVRAGIISHTIPREVVAFDVHTESPYQAPPVPYGAYAKDYLGSIAEACGLVRGCFSGLLHGCCPNCGGGGCDQCGGTGKCGHCGDPCGEFAKGCGFCGWRGLLHGCSDPAVSCDGGICIPQHPVKACSFVGKASTICASGQAPTPIVSPQGSCASPQMLCSKPGCLLKMRHFHKMGNGCNACNGMGCGICHGGGDPCSFCGGKGCHHCCGLGSPCSFCGGKGCHHCCGLGSKLLGLPASLIGKLFHVGEIDYFVGPGGRVPITPGYVPYVVSTRSPRDFFAFPPFSQVDP